MAARRPAPRPGREDGCASMFPRTRTPRVSQSAGSGNRDRGPVHVGARDGIFGGCMRFPRARAVHMRSEEHTSELQSRENLVCRLLLEKKKKKVETRLSS